VTVIDDQTYYKAISYLYETMFEIQQHVSAAASHRETDVFLS